MTTKQRMEALKKWLYEECCQDKRLKTPGKNMDLTDIQYAEPKVYIGWAPTRQGQSEDAPVPSSVHPCMILMIYPSKARAMEERRFDRFSGINRPKDLGATLEVSILFCTYDPGNRLKGFVETEDPARWEDNTEEGFFTLTDWMDEVKEKLLGIKSIPGTDLFIWDESITFSPYTEMGMLVDKRPFYYGFVNCSFGNYANQAPNAKLKELLD